MKIILKNYFLYLVLYVKNLFSEKGNTSQPPASTWSSHHHHQGKAQPTTNHPKSRSRRGKKSPPLLRYHQNTTIQTTTITTKSKIKEKEYQTQKYVGGLVRVREKKWDERWRPPWRRKGGWDRLKRGMVIPFQIELWRWWIRFMQSWKRCLTGRRWGGVRGWGRNSPWVHGWRSERWIGDEGGVGWDLGEPVFVDLGCLADAWSGRWAAWSRR